MEVINTSSRRLAKSLWISSFASKLSLRSISCRRSLVRAFFMTWSDQRYLLFQTTKLWSSNCVGSDAILAQGITKSPGSQLLRRTSPRECVDWMRCRTSTSQLRRFQIMCNACQVHMVIYYASLLRTLLKGLKNNRWYVPVIHHLVLQPPLLLVSIWWRCPKEYAFELFHLNSFKDNKKCIWQSLCRYHSNLLQWCHDVFETTTTWTKYTMPLWRLHDMSLSLTLHYVGRKSLATSLEDTRLEFSYITCQGKQVWVLLRACVLQRWFATNAYEEMRTSSLLWVLLSVLCLLSGVCKDASHHLFGLVTMELSLATIV